MLYKQYIYNENSFDNLLLLIMLINITKKGEMYSFSLMPHQNCNDFPESAIILFYVNVHRVSMNHRDHEVSNNGESCELVQ